jgi:hypothetical protein
MYPQLHFVRGHRLAQLAGACVRHRGFPTHHRSAMVPPPRSGEGSAPHPAPIGTAHQSPKKGRRSLPQRGRGDHAKHGGWGNHGVEVAAP